MSEPAERKSRIIFSSIPQPIFKRLVAQARSESLSVAAVIRRTLSQAFPDDQAAR